MSSRDHYHRRHDNRRSDWRPPRVPYTGRGDWQGGQRLDSPYRRSSDREREYEHERDLKRPRTSLSPQSGGPRPAASLNVGQLGTEAHTQPSASVISQHVSSAASLPSTHDKDDAKDDTDELSVPTSDDCHFDSDDEDVEERERLQAEERRRKRAEILAKHATQLTATSPHDTPNSSGSMRFVEPITATAAQPSTLVPATVKSSLSAVPAPAADDFDLFSDSPSALPKTTAIDTAVARVDAFDDSEGYYLFRAGDTLVDTVCNRRFQIYSEQGTGVFSSVFRCREITDSGSASDELAVKILRNNSTMLAAGLKEAEFLRRLASLNARHVIPLLHHFYHRSHLCLVFPAYSMDLRRVIRKFGSVGLALAAVKVYAHQLLIALHSLAEARIIHGDLKPDNIVINDQMNSLAVCDFGSACNDSDTSITSYLQSRFYRAPEVMLGLDYDSSIDQWSVGCIVYELYTGKILFGGANNNEMLHAIQLVTGALPIKLVKRGQFTDRHYTANYQFVLKKVDSVTNIVHSQIVQHSDRPQRDLLALLKESSAASTLRSSDEMRRLRHLHHFIHVCLTLDPSKRPSVAQLLKHPFIAD